MLVPSLTGSKPAAAGPRLRGFLALSALVFTPLALATPTRADVEWRARTYALYLDPPGSGNRHGWGVGEFFSAAVPPGSEKFSFGFGIEGGAIQSTQQLVDDPQAGALEYTNTHGLQRLFAGVAAGRFAHHVQPYGAVNLALMRHDVETRVFVTDAGLFESLRADTETRLGWDLEVGLIVMLDRTRRTSLELGVRFLGSQGTSIPRPDGSETSPPEYLQYFFGAGFAVGR